MAPRLEADLAAAHRDSEVLQERAAWVFVSSSSLVLSCLLDVTHYGIGPQSPPARMLLPRAQRWKPARAVLQLPHLIVLHSGIAQAAPGPDGHFGSSHVHSTATVPLAPLRLQ